MRQNSFGCEKSKRLSSFDYLKRHFCCFSQKCFFIWIIHLQTFIAACCYYVFQHFISTLVHHMEENPRLVLLWLSLYSPVSSLFKRLWPSDTLTLSSRPTDLLQPRMRHKADVMLGPDYQRRAPPGMTGVSLSVSEVRECFSFPERPDPLCVR